MSNQKCRSIMYDCTKLTPNSDIFPDEMKVIMENIVSLKKVPLMHLMVIILSGVAHWSSRTVLNIDIDWDIPLIFYGVIIGYPGSNKSTAISLIERATREVEKYLQIKIEDSHVNGSVTIESLLHELSKKTSIIQAFDEFNTFASSFSLYRTDKATYYRSVLNTLWNGPSCYFRQLVKGDVKCENPWLSIVAAAHPGTITTILKDENNQTGADGLFARFIFSARVSPEDVHKRRKREIDSITGEYAPESYCYPSLTHIMYFLYLMHHNEVLKLKISDAANEILIRTHNEYNNIVIDFQGYEDIICTLFSKSRDHLYRICGLLHLFHQACTYVLKARPQLEYLIFDDASAESIQQMAKLAQQNINEYLTISPEIARTAVELMTFYVETKKTLHGFPLKNDSCLTEIHIGPSASQTINIERSNEQLNDELSNNDDNNNNNNNDNHSILSNNSKFSSLSSSICPFDGKTIDATIKKILFCHNRIISSNRVAQMLRRPNVNSDNVKKVFVLLSNCQMGTYKIEKQKKGKPRSLFIKADLPEDKESFNYKAMAEFLNEFHLTPDQYMNTLQSLIRFRSSEQKNKRARLFNDNDKLENFESDTSSSCSYNSSDQYNSKTIFYNYNEIFENNNETLHMIDEYSTILIDNSDQQNSFMNNAQQLYKSNKASIYKYFTVLPSAKKFKQINNLNQNIKDFHIRCKTIYKTAIQYIGSNEKLFYATICDSSSEIKVVAFNEEVDSFYNIMITNETITIENGDVRIASEKFRSPYSIYEIRLISSTKIKSYKCISFNPIMITKNQPIQNLFYIVHGSSVDIEGTIIMDRGVSTRICNSSGTIIRNRTLQMKDETAIIYIIIWNDKIEELPDSILHQNIRIRNAKLNHIKSNSSQKTNS
ncbi:unnamed protein product [Rotaria magnacalcarata]|uniref:Uncharacterized protein n=1 Tax=Rotaria magnacalcarata TaxID=392030 RepID=A0A816RCJ7_9BILA|nr:unnamed protein product [Rotaria magnacalcarata]